MIKIQDCSIFLNQICKNTRKLKFRNTWILSLQYCPLFNTDFAIEFFERAIQGKNLQSMLLTARMGQYGIKVALLRCLIRLIIVNVAMDRRSVSLDAQ